LLFARYFIRKNLLQLTFEVVHAAFVETEGADDAQTDHAFLRVTDK
jgi:hypothetical protein